MNTREEKSENLVKVPKHGLLSLVASKLKNRILFPEKVEEAKRFLKNAKISA